MARSHKTGSRWPGFAASLAIAVVSLAAAHEHETTTAAPGFRPETEFSGAFVDAADSATVAVYPTIVRRNDRTAHSFASQQQVAAYINENGLATAQLAPKRVNLGALHGSGFASQWELFTDDMAGFADGLQGRLAEARYHLVLEFVLPVSDQAIFGVHCYILDDHGRNAFSFLLNSHHQLFVDAELVATGKTEAARDRMMASATEAALLALQGQLEQARAAEPAAEPEAP